mmetsp:Transcript_129/g.391  ORF Transcript_129/g.391 Transcript_129/m.391 type:complete len:99 (+) Transcript_129:73-369(+)
MGSRGIVRMVGKGKALETIAGAGEGGASLTKEAKSLSDSQEDFRSMISPRAREPQCRSRSIIRYGGRSRLTLGIPLPRAFRRMKFLPSLPVIPEEMIM